MRADVEAARQYKAELQTAAEAVAERAGGVEHVVAGLSEAQLQRCFVVLSYLVHFFVWCEDGVAEQVVPREVALPYYRVAKALGFEPVYTDAVIMWNMVGRAGEAEVLGSCDPGEVFLEFSWTGTQSERWFAVVQGAILRLLDPLMGRALQLKEETLPAAAARLAAGEYAATSPEDAATHALVVGFLDDLDEALVQARTVMGRMFERLDPNDFLVFRRYFEGWKSSSQYSTEHLPDGLTLQGVEAGGASVVLSGVPGANAGQQGSWHVVDALLGLEHDEDFLRQQRPFMPAAQRAFVARFTRADALELNLRSYFDARPELDRAPARAPYSRAVASLRAWRREHISLAGMYLINFAREIEADATRAKTGNPLHVKGTGGSETKAGKQGGKGGGFVQLLQSYIRETRDPNNSNSAAAAAAAGHAGAGEGMQCPLKSARQYLRGPRFTKQVYLETTRAREAADAADAATAPHAAPSALAPSSAPAPSASAPLGATALRARLAKLEAERWRVDAEVAALRAQLRRAALGEFARKYGLPAEAGAELAALVAELAPEAAGGAPLTGGGFQP